MNRRVTAVVVAVLLALVGTAAVLMYVRSADKRAVAGQEPVEVYVAQKFVPAGTSLSDAVADDLISQEMVAAKGVPSTPLPTMSPSTAQMVAVSDIQPGELVLSDRFGSKAATKTPLAIPSGQMAVTVALTDPAHVGPFVTAGSQIAVFDTFNVQKAPGITPAGDHIQDGFDKTRATRILLSKVTVLAVGASTAAQDPTAQQQAAQTNGATQGPQATTLYTLAVTQSQAELLVHGTQTGTLYFALLTDASTVTTDGGVNDRTLFESR
jgi:pilus assembly protein CpaB